jgi:hypothetical protein
VEWFLGEFGEWKRFRPRKEVYPVEWARKNPEARAVIVVEGSDLISVHCISAVDGVILNPRDGSEECPYRVDRVYTLVSKKG